MNRFNVMSWMISVVLEVTVLFLVSVFQHVMRKEKTTRIFVGFVFSRSVLLKLLNTVVV